MYCLHDSSRRPINLLVKHLHVDHGMTAREIARWFDCSVHEVKDCLAKVCPPDNLVDHSDPRLFPAKPTGGKRRRNK